ncbi:ABC transporter [Rhodospirillum rubrum]|uniref:ABC-F family ATP-binding cassette domain-containing protein n=1 Tax=Rhodospirillum rubrum TaxID=1085 RepID=UPI0019042E77|nr:ABC-F family ATP-binding cassette domain-containing protein [Rhodospirillum rubrum]MBK1665977.1 ABC transporter [Rhodospirillum rubrum]MBK1677944.1 ABC transporter [Rhodospirillum rubrum]
MSASIALANLGWSTPDGTALFTNLTLTFGPERIGLVGRNGAGKTTLLRLIQGALAPQAGTIQVTGTLGWLRQDVSSTPKDTLADLFGAAPALALLDRAEIGQATATELAEADWTLPARIESALSRFGIEADLQTPLYALSGGQRTRAGLAALIFSAPDFLLLDEPTNTLDRSGRQAVIDLIKGWRGGAIVVSHDREVLEEIDGIVDLTTLGATFYAGNYSHYRLRRAEDLQTAAQDVAHAAKRQAESDRRAQQAAERKARRDSAGRKARVRNDQPKILLDRAKERAETSGGANARLREARRKEAQADLAAARARIEVLQPIRMDIPSTHLPADKLVARLEGVTGGYDADRPVIGNLSLTLTGPERIAFTGPNGCGKTTLLWLITGKLRAQRGRIDLYVPHAFLDQQVGLLDPGLSIRDNFVRLTPQADENQCRAALARFRFRAGDALQTVGTLSGGQKLRAGLACTLGRAQPPGLLMLDEPTNHLDLEGIEALEAALSAYDGALLVVSHDEAFLERLSLDRRVDLRSKEESRARR